MKQLLPNPELHNLHVVRGLAAFIVVIFHAKFALWVGGNEYVKAVGLNSVPDYIFFAFDMLSSCGEQCVIIFFILSAIVIRHSFQKYRNRLLVFYKIRLIRIYVPFLLSLILGISILFLSINFINPAVYSESLRNYNLRLVHAADQFSVNQVINAVFFTGRGEYAGANFAYWSLGHELIFYLLFPLYMMPRITGKITLGIVLIAAFYISGFSIFYYQVFFIAGLLLYDLFMTRNKPLFNPGISLVLTLVLFVAINLVLKVWSETIADILTLGLCIVLFDHLLFRPKMKKGVLTGLADISYTLYLVHLPLLLLYYALISRITGDLIFFERWPYYSGVVFALLLAVPLYRLIERPSIRLLKNMR